MFEFLSRRKRTLVEKIVDSARRRIIKKRDHHRNEADRLANIITGQLAQMRHHKDTFQALDEALYRLDNPMPVLPELFIPEWGTNEPTPEFQIDFPEDFGLGEELAGDAVTADMGDGRSATESDTLAKIESASEEITALGMPQRRLSDDIEDAGNRSATPLADEVIAQKRKPRRQRKPHTGLVLQAGE